LLGRVWAAHEVAASGGRKVRCSVAHESRFAEEFGRGLGPVSSLALFTCFPLKRAKTYNQGSNPHPVAGWNGTQSSINKIMVVPQDRSSILILSSLRCCIFACFFSSFPHMLPSTFLIILFLLLFRLFSFNLFLKYIFSCFSVSHYENLFSLHYNLCSPQSIRLLSLQMDLLPTIYGIFFICLKFFLSINGFVPLNL
jgi:hypothetical protein